MTDPSLTLDIEIRPAPEPPDETLQALAPELELFLQVASDILASLTASNAAALEPVETTLQPA